MKNTYISIILIILICTTVVCTAQTMEELSIPKSVSVEANQELKLENLLSTQLEGFEGAEVIVSRVSIPANTSLPKHWHPGEEFAYILEGSVVLWQKDKEEIIGKKGDVMKVPIKQIHTAFTKDEGATILVFRVHEQGKPERIKVE